MTNVDKLKKINKLDAVIGRLGGGEYGYRANRTEDIYKEIEALTNHQLIAKVSGWELGSESWWEDMKNSFDKLEELNNG